MTALILQARLDSGRLPQKALLPLDGAPIVVRVMEALRNVKADAYILASPEDCEDSFSTLAEACGFQLVTGSKDDVLSRYCKAARLVGADYVIRATGDNPFVFSDAAEALENEALLLDSDYAAYAKLPHGAGVEIVKCEALFRAETSARFNYEKEHVCPYLYAHPEIFALHRPLAPQKWRHPDLHITVDTQADYERARVLYDALKKENAPHWEGERVIRIAESAL